MTTVSLGKPNELMGDHYRALRAYAERAALRGEVFAAAEEDDKAHRLEQYFAIGAEVGCTKKELTALLYTGLFRAKKKCGCFNCRMRSNVS